MFDVFYIRNPLVNGPVGRQVKTIEEARQKSRTRFCWVVDGSNDYSNFDWLWEPKPWEAQQDHVWPSQHQENGGTTLITKQSTGDVNYSHQPVERVTPYSIIVVDHGNKGTSELLETLKSRYKASSAPIQGTFSDTVWKLQESIKEPTWVISSLNDYTGFDFTWHPGEYDHGKLHIFGTQYQEFGGGAYLISPETEEIAELECHPSLIQRVATEEIIFVDHGNEGSQEQYEKLASKYEVTKTRFYGTTLETVERIRKRLTKPAWVISSLNSYSDFDFLWYPSMWDEEYEFRFFSQWARPGGTFRLTPNAKGIKDHSKIVHRTYEYPAIIVRNNDAEVNADNVTRWFGSTRETVDRIQKRITEPTWVFFSANKDDQYMATWHPRLEQEGMTHIWGTQHHGEGGAYLIWPESRGEVYHEKEEGTFKRVLSYDIALIDYGNPHDIEFYDWSTRFFGSIDETLERIQKKITKPTWVISSTNDYSEFDFTWHSPISQEGNTQVWPSQHQGDGGTYLLWPNAETNSNGTNYNWMVVPRVAAFDVTVIDCGNANDTLPTGDRTRLFGTLGDTLERIRRRISSPTWVAPSTNDFEGFDPTWHPPRSQENVDQIWPTQHQREGGLYLLYPPAQEPGGSTVPRDINYNDQVFPRLSTYPIMAIDYSNTTENEIPASAERTRYFGSVGATLERIQARISEPTWVVSTLNDYSKFDFTWHPPASQEGVKQIWPSQHQKDGNTYLVYPNGEGENFNEKLVPRKVPFDIIVIDHGNTPFNMPAGATKKRFYGSTEETLARIQEHLSRPTWVLDSRNDYQSFDFTWHPPASQEGVKQVFASQHQRDSGTYLIDMKDDDKKHAVKYLSKFVRRVHKPDIVYLDFGTPNADEPEGAYITRFIDNYLDTIKRVIQKYEDKEHIWITASVCDYSTFDFTWHPALERENMLTVFPSEDEKYGDTMYVPVKEFVKQAKTLQRLEWFDKIHHEDTTVDRHPFDFVFHHKDSQADAVKEYDFEGPYAIYSNTIERRLQPTPNLWRQATRAIYPLTPGATSVLVPRDARNCIDGQLYDYPVIDKSFDHVNQDYPLDIVFLSNGETNANENYKQLVTALGGDEKRITRIDGVNGRVAAYQACAEVSETDWLFIVWGKLEVSLDFDWDWQPDRMQAAKHYIFYARNPVNDLEYGHMGMAAYNKRLTMENDGTGLDFIMSQPHEVVPVVSGTAQYAHNPWMAWRTAFREALKLQSFIDEKGDVAAKSRLKAWLTVGNGEFGEWSTRGADDALKYYQQNNGEYEALKKSYEWAWLRDLFSSLYPQHTQFLDQ